MIIHNDNKIAYVHIPRTGGRLLCSNLMINFKTELFSWNDWVNYNDIPIEKNHQPASMYENIKTKFTVVRNPYTRFLSILKEYVYFGFNFTENTSLDDLLKFVDTDKRLLHMACWFLPQYKFIDEDTKIWHYEDGLNNTKFITWLNENIGLNLTKQTNELYSKFNSIIKNDELKLTPHLKDVVRDIYAEDFKKFNYLF